MNFIEPDLSEFLILLEKLTIDSKPTWGKMSAQRMVEHLTDGIRMSMGEGDFHLEIPEDRVSKMVLFLESDKPMAQNIQVSFATPEMELRTLDLDDAIDEFTLAWVDFEELYEYNPSFTALHPYYGDLNYEQWQRLHSKHFTHHFSQFGLIQ
jgi:hypothetical protein